MGRSDGFERGKWRGVFLNSCSIMPAAVVAPLEIYQLGGLHLAVRQFCLGSARSQRRQGAAVPGWSDGNGLVADFFRELF